MTDVFISYSRKDTEFVRKLHDSLEESGRDVWIDWENIPLTADWLEEIKEGIESSDNFIYVISPDSVHSDVCAVELGHALENRKRLIPVVYRELVEEYDKAALHPTISSHNWLFFREDDVYDEAFDALTDALESDLEHMRIHTRLLVKAKEWLDRNRDSSGLLRGSELREAEEWLSVAMSKNPEPTELHTEYIMASHNIANTRQRRFLLFMSAGFIISISLAILSFVFFQIAQRRDLVSRSLAVAFAAKQTDDRILSIALAVAASQIDNPPVQVQRALSDVVYDPGVRKWLRNPDAEAGTALNEVAYSPDGRWVAAASGDGTVVLWDLETGELVRRLGAKTDNDSADALRHTNEVVHVTFNADSTRLLSASRDHRIIVWDIASGEHLLSYRHDAAVAVAIFHPEEDTLLVGNANGNITIHEAATGETIQTFDDFDDDEFTETGTAHPAGVTAAAFDPRGSYMATAGADGYVAIWEIATGDQMMRVKLHDGPINELIYTPDGEHILTASDDETAKKVSTDGGSIEITFVGHTNRVLDLDVSPDGQFVITASRDRTIIYWDIVNGNQLVRLWGHGNWVTGVDFHRGGRWVVSSSADGTVIEWDLLPGNIVQVYRGHTDWIRTVDLSNDETLAVSGSDDDTVRIWDIAAATSNTLTGHTGDVRGVHFTPDDTQVVSVSLDGTARVWDVQSGELLGGPYTPHDGVGIHSLDISPDGEWAISGADDGTVRVWNVATGERMMTLVQHTEPVLDVRFSPDGRQALSASEDVHVIYWNLENRRVIHNFEPQGARESLSIAFSPDGTLAVSGSRNAQFFVWDLEAGAQQAELLGHGSSVRGAAFHPNGQWAMSASADLSLILWDLEAGEQLREFNGHERTVYSVDFSQDGLLALSGSRDKTLILWRIDSFDALLQWVGQNRFTRHLEDSECELFGIDCNYTFEGIDAAQHE